MADTKLTFKRYEKKYVLSPEKYAALRARIDDLIEPDVYFRSTVCSIYYDTDKYELIRRSIEGPVYKEKLRLRSYNVQAPDGEAFVELKKKYKGVVYKRRIRMTPAEAEAYLSGRAPAPDDSQISREIDWFLSFYKPKPKVFIACDRSAYIAKDDPELRITFDLNLRQRTERLSLTEGDDGEPLLGEGWALMEIKIPGTAPLWLARTLSELEIFPTSYSKYGTCYKNDLYKNILSE